MKSLSFSLVLAALGMVPSVLCAQQQPAAAANNQDEAVQIVRQADANAESFKILRSGDKAEINRYVTRVYSLQHANPMEILPYLRTAAALERGSVNTAWNPQPDGTNRAWIQVNVPEFQLSYFDDAVAAYDVEGFASIPGDIRFSYRTKYRSAVEVADFIRATVISGDGFIKGDGTTNTIYVNDSPSDFRRVLAQIQFYDVPAPQVDVEVTLLELTNVDQTSLGLDWDAWKSSVSGNLDLTGTSTHTETNGVTSNSTSRGSDALLSLDASVAARFLNYMVDKGKATVRARTNVTVTNGTVATLTSGTQVPEFQYAFSKDTGKATLTEQPSVPADPAAEGVTLALRPVVASEAARLGVDISMRSPVAIGKMGAPIYSTQTVSADLTLAQGQLYKLGGLRRKVSAKEEKGIPGLRKVPGLKYLFGNEAVILRETELYIFLKPTWTSPVVPAIDGMQVYKPTAAEKVEGILQANPNLSISPEDSALLDRYFAAAEAGKK